MAKILWIPGKTGEHQPTLQFLQTIKHQFKKKELPELLTLLTDINSESFDLILSADPLAEPILTDFLTSRQDIPVVVLAEAGQAESLSRLLAAGAADGMIMDSAGEYLRLLPFFIERCFTIKHLKKQIQQVPPNQQEYEAIIQNLPDIIYKIDPKGYFSFVNRAIHILGYEPDELIGKHFKEIIHPEDYSKVAWQEIIKKPGNGEIPSAHTGLLFNERRQEQRCNSAQEIRLIPKSWREDTPGVVIGSVTTIGEVSARGHYREENGANDFLGTTGIIFNITGDKKSQALILKLFQVTDQSPISIIITDPAGMIEYVNPHFLELSGYTLQEVTGQAVTLLKTQRIHPGSYTDFSEIIRTSCSWQGEVISLKKNGAGFWESVIIKPLIDPEGVIANYVIIKVDIDELKETQEVLKTINNELDRRVTQRTCELENTNRELQQEIEERINAQKQQKKLEEQLLQSQKMETIGTMAGGIAHDFNNILTPILGFSNLAILEIGEGKPGFMEIHQIQTAANRAKELVQQILSFASVVDPKRIPVEINSILEEALNLIRASLPATIEIRKEYNLEYGLILANPSQIHQVIINLCTNAAHAMQGSYGILEIRLQQLMVRDQQAGIPEELQSDGNHLLKAGKYIRLDICDTGNGIRREIINRIFDPFFTTKSKKQGTGLGLSVALGIVTNHDGKITVNSIPGQGTTFSIFLPLYEGEELDPLQEHIELKGGDEHILYVDDEPQVALTITKMLSLLGYHVTRFTESTKALDAYKANPGSFDLIMTDYTMPIITGLELIEEVHRFGCKIPIILVTGYGDGILLKDSESLGIASILMKPLSLYELGKAVRKVLDLAST